MTTSLTTTMTNLSESPIFNLGGLATAGSFAGMKIMGFVSAVGANEWVTLGVGGLTGVYLIIKIVTALMDAIKKKK